MISDIDSGIGIAKSLSVPIHSGHLHQVYTRWQKKHYSVFWGVHKGQCDIPNSSFFLTTHWKNRWRVTGTLHHQAENVLRSTEAKEKHENVSGKLCKKISLKTINLLPRSLWNAANQTIRKLPKYIYFIIQQGACYTYLNLVEAEHLVNKYMTLISCISFYNLMEIQMVKCMNINRNGEAEKMRDCYNISVC